MRKFWGAATEITDLGVVAESCPHCTQVVPCLLRSVSRDHYACFVKTADPWVERSCLCTGCLKPFRGEHWRYTATLPIREARALSPEDLLARTNPGLAERIEMKELVRDLGGDHRFAVAYEQLEQMRPGALRSGMLRQLLAWDRLPEEQRVFLAEQVAARARAWQFSRQIAPAFPDDAAPLAAVVAALVMGPVFLWTPGARTWLWGGATVVAGLAAACFVGHAISIRRVRRWTRHTLIPEAQDANISLGCLLDVVDDVPGSGRGLLEDLWPMKVQLETIRGVLTADGILGPAAAPPASKSGVNGVGRHADRKVSGA
jgi:hypothetical protein